MDDSIDDETDDQNPVQQSIIIHRRRICIILQLMLEKLEIAFALEKLLAGEGELEKHLSRRDFHSILESGSKMHTQSGLLGSNSKSKMDSRSKLDSKSRINSSKSRMKKNISTEFKQDPNYSNMIATLHRNKAILKEAKAIVSQMPPAHTEFITEMYELRGYIEDMLNTSAAKERAYNKQIGASWTNNEKYKRRNAEMTTIHENKIHELSFKIAEKESMINTYKDQIEQNEEKCIADLHKIINESERLMAKTTTTSLENQEVLNDEAKFITNQYESLLHGHLAHEKTLRVKRYKVETVLAGWLTKYDTDIGELQAQLEEEQDGYNKEKADFDSLTENFNNQNVLYEMLMAEKEEEEQRLFDIRRYEFIANRSARLIQRWWRGILSRRYRKRKGKGKGKGKGKKK